MMGTPVNPNDPGVLCAACWGPGQTYGDSPTPKYVRMTFSGYHPGDLWLPAYESHLLTPHILIQQLDPCQWAIQDALFNWFVSMAGVHPVASIITRAALGAAFIDNVGINCKFAYSNDLIDAPGNVCFDGGVLVDWNPEDLV